MLPQEKGYLLLVEEVRSAERSLKRAGGVALFLNSAAFPLQAAPPRGQKQIGPNRSIKEKLSGGADRKTFCALQNRAESIFKAVNAIK